MSYVQRALTFIITLAAGTPVEQGPSSPTVFGQGGNTLTLSGYRATATIAKRGSPSLDTATMRIYGMTLDLMNQIGTHWLPVNIIGDNTVTILAGNVGGAMSVAFQGWIATAWANLTGSPDAFFEMTAMTALLPKIQPALPRSYPGPVDVATILAGIATQMGMNFENHGVSVILNGPYFPGTAMEQAQAAAQAAHISMHVDGTTMTIMPLDGNIGGTIPLISPETGMVGYPRFTGSGISVRSLYDPNFKFNGQVRVKSSIQAASGIWTVWGLTHDLACQYPNGPWFSDIEGRLTGPQ